MIHERHQRVGSFELKLEPDAPSTIRQAVAEFGHIVVCDVEVNPDEVSDATVLAAARWSGVVTKPPVDGEIRGWGAGWWLGGAGDHQGNAVEQTAVTFSGVSLSSALSTLLPGTEAIAAGTVTTTGLSTVTGSFTLLSRWAILAQLCALAGAEFVVRPDFTVDAAADDVLFPTAAAPTVILTRNPDPLDVGGLRGVELDKLVPAEDWDAYATKVVAVGQAGAGAAVVVGTATRATSYLDGRGNAAVLKRFVNAPSTPETDADTVAQAVLNLSTGRQSLRLAATGQVRPWLSPGDGVWVWDLDAGLVDDANQVEYKAETISPVLLRVQGMDWPVQQGAGVYYRSASGTYTDLTRYMQWETQATTVIVGQDVGGVTDDVGIPMSSVESDILARAGLAALGTWTPVVDGTTTDPTLSGAAGTYRIDGGTLHAEFKCTFSVNGSGTYTITGLPVVPVAGRASFLDGRGRMVDASTSEVQYAALVVNDSGVITIRYVASAAPGAEVQPTNALPWTWASGDTIEGRVSYPIL